uniref:Uncharacterized protein n=1 Tax=Rhizophagus irregularis (strain DAOM 181602 / DAOM 197198 / MUCL 43194) TaxID=747089 RepID=U9T996_RHIID
MVDDEVMVDIERPGFNNFVSSEVSEKSSMDTSRRDLGMDLILRIGLLLDDVDHKPSEEGEGGALRCFAIKKAI